MCHRWDNSNLLPWRHSLLLWYFGKTEPSYSGFGFLIFITFLTWSVFTWIGCIFRMMETMIFFKVGKVVSEKSVPYRQTDDRLMFFIFRFWEMIHFWSIFNHCNLKLYSIKPWVIRTSLFANSIVLDSTNKPTTFKFHWFFGEVWEFHEKTRQIAMLRGYQWVLVTCWASTNGHW